MGTTPTGSTPDRDDAGSVDGSEAAGDDSDDREVAHPLAGASVLVAGASGGFGSALACALDRRGAVLTLVARRDGPLDAVDAPGRRVALDLRTPTACRAAVAAATDHGGRLDVVVNAVGVVAFGPVAELSPDAMEELFLTNTFVAILLAQAALGQLADGGAIVQLSGVIAERNLPGMAAYGASKAAVRAFDEALAREARRDGLRILDARPPHTETGLAGRPIEGTAPNLGPGLDPVTVAEVVCDALESGARDLPSDAFSA